MRFHGTLRLSGCYQNRKKFNLTNVLAEQNYANPHVANSRHFDLARCIFQDDCLDLWDDFRLVEESFRKCL